jgi:hypothetical protein
MWTLPEMFGAPVDGGSVSWWLAAGDHVLVVVGIAIDRLVVGVPAVRWDSQEPVVELQSVEMLDCVDSGVDTVDWFRTRVTTAITTRRSTFRRCGRCHDRVAPERMFDREICQVCAQVDGVVF